MSLRRQFKQLKHVKMTTPEKDAIHGHLLAEIHNNPVKQHIARTPEVRFAAPARLNTTETHSSHFLFITNKLRPMLVSLLIAAILALSGTTSYAAENTLPGDTLYPIKIHVNEQVRDALTLGDEAQAHWNVRKVERRLEESNKLKAQGDLDTRREKIVHDELSQELQDTNELLIKLQLKQKTDEATNINARIQAILKTQVATQNADTSSDTTTTVTMTTSTPSDEQTSIGESIHILILRELDHAREVETEIHSSTKSETEKETEKNERLDTPMTTTSPATQAREQEKKREEKQNNEQEREVEKHSAPDQIISTTTTVNVVTPQDSDVEHVSDDTKNNEEHSDEENEHEDEREDDSSDDRDR